MSTLTQNSKIEFDLDFSQFPESVDNFVHHFKAKQLIKGKITHISDDFVTVDIGFKSNCMIHRSEFGKQIELVIDKEIELYFENFEDSQGQTIISREKAEKYLLWEEIKQKNLSGETVRGVVTAKIKGGLSVDIGLKAFLPNSQIDLRPIKDLDSLIDQEFEYKVLKINQKRGNIVLSRRALLELDREDQRLKTIELLKEGEIVSGHIKNITDYGVFVDLGGIDGLLHITDITWGRIIHPSEMFEVGDKIEVVILNYDKETDKVSLGLKQKQLNPWEKVEEKYPVDTKIQGKIVSITNYGAFIELEEGVEGLIHVSEMSWEKKTRLPSSMVEMGDIVEAVVKEIEVEKRRISLSMKEVLENPWKQIADKYPEGTVVEGTIRNITDFGIFVGLIDGIDGLVHTTDISWSQRTKKMIDTYSKGQQIQVKILNIDVDKGRLSLGIKQLTENPWLNIESNLKTKQEIKGKVVHIADFGIFVEIQDGIEGLIHVSELGEGNQANKKTLHQKYPINSTITAYILSIEVAEKRLALTLQDNASVEEVAEEEGETAPTDKKSDDKKEKVKKAVKTKSKDAEKEEPSETIAAVDEAASHDEEQQAAASKEEQKDEKENDAE